MMFIRADWAVALKEIADLVIQWKRSCSTSGSASFDLDCVIDLDCVRKEKLETVRDRFLKRSEISRD
jgi:hypothetical protein